MTIVKNHVLTKKRERTKPATPNQRSKSMQCTQPYFWQRNRRFDLCRTIVWRKDQTEHKCSARFHEIVTNFGWKTEILKLHERFKFLDLWCSKNKMRFCRLWLFFFSLNFTWLLNKSFPHRWVLVSLSVSVHLPTHVMNINESQSR